ATAPAAPAANNAGRPVRTAARKPPPRANAIWSITTVPAARADRPAPSASAASSAHHCRMSRRGHAGLPVSSAASGAAVAARTAAVTPRPAHSAAATSNIEAIQQPRRLADAGELRADTLGRSFERAHAMPAAILAERHQFAYGSPTVVQTGNEAHRNQSPAATGRRVGRAPDHPR